MGFLFFPIWVWSSACRLSGPPGLCYQGVLAMRTATTVTKTIKKKLFLFYLRMSQVCKSVEYAYRSRYLLRLNIRVLQSKYKVVFSQRNVPRFKTNSFSSLSHLLVILAVAVVVVVCKNSVLGNIPPLGWAYSPYEREHFQCNFNN